VSVKPGYARNYLLPKGLAYIDSEANQRRFAEEQQQWEDMDLQRRSAAEAVSAQLEGTELIFERRASEKDVLFGSVSVHDIARRLTERGIEIDRKRVQLAEPIKALGSYEVELQVHRDIKLTLPVQVVRPGEQPGQSAEEGASEPANEAPAEETIAAKADTLTEPESDTTTTEEP